MRAAALLLVLLLAPAAGCLRPAAVERDVAPVFTVTTIDGESFALADQLGRVVLLDFMATWCVPCRKQIPEFADVKARHPDVVALSIDVDPTEDAATLARFRDEVGADWAFALDTAAARVHYEVLALPKQVLVDAEGRIAWETAPGQVVDGARLEREIRRLG